ncbi:12107_t:CDS:2 [Rhizophagus irregularis]|nr:12107_t:CDS:2 [Rhizophagus irregularis]
MSGIRAHPWEIKKSRWNRDNNKEVAIKKFRNATVSEFLDEIKNNLSLNFAAYCNVIYGVTCDPHDNKYAIVMKYQNLDWDTILSKLELNDKQIAIKLEIEKEFSQEREDRWKARLSELTINPHPLKHSQNFLTSKRLEYSKQLNQLLDKNDTTYTRQFDMSLCLPKLKTKEEFSQEREDRWKVLSKFINSHPLILANKRLEYSKKLNQLNDTTYYTRQFDMSLCLPKVLDNYV